ncbi:hypothetical protein AWB77_04528 [Caballeronia fortuita]|uniref:Uncharacterized protein n=1 Tax=Caballeronia fortuita TaxID=1777138 RepID=A0A158CTW0_9BURK|nr:hypothetical protein [Caballeronia fortuita]SAK85754.1 hypothetical protein AWB77_04528 [Caballeronia fortuita]
MTTDDLIGLLSTKAAPVDQACSVRCATALPLGMLASFIIMILVLGAQQNLINDRIPFIIGMGPLLAVNPIERPGDRAGAARTLLALPLIPEWSV